VTEDDPAEPVPDAATGDPFRVVVIDDHAILRQGVVRLLQDEPRLRVVGDAEGILAGEPIVERESPDIVVLDLDMPGIDGVEGCRRLRARRPDLGVVMLSMHDEPLMARRAFAAGARAYVVKSAGNAELVRAILAVASGGRYVNAALGARLAAGAGRRGVDDLTGREVDVLRLLSLGFTNQEVAERLNLSARTIESHRQHIMAKLRLSTRAQMVRVALDAGLLSVTAQDVAD